MKKWKIDKSQLTAEEQRQYEALIAKAKVEEDREDDAMIEDDLQEDVKVVLSGEEEAKDLITEDEDKTVDNEEKGAENAAKKTCKKSAIPEMAGAMARLEQLEKSMEMATFRQIAKKYGPLGEQEEALAKTLYEMKKSNRQNYDAYVAVLDKSLALVEKSGLFAEIGKSTSGIGGAVNKIQAMAGELMKSDSSLSRTQAVAKAWENHPELVTEYEAECNA